MSSRTTKLAEFESDGKGLADQELLEELSSEDDSEEISSQEVKCGGCCLPGAAVQAEMQQMEDARFTTPGSLGDLSHDHSPHVTDEVFNAASHLMGGLLSVLGTSVLVTGAGAHHSPWGVISFALYGASLMFPFFASFAHHAIKGSPKLMKLLRTLDYVAIYFLIPGTMMPVCFVCLHDSWTGWVFFGTSTGIAIFGVALQTVCPMELPTWASMTMYVTLGWFGAFLAVPAYKCLELGGALLLLFGGLAYTGGGMIFTLQCPNPVPGKFGFHEIWHVCVLAGAGLHWCCMFFYVWPHMNANEESRIGSVTLSY